MVIRKWSTEEDFEESLSLTCESTIILALHNENELHEYSPDGKLIRKICLPAEICNPMHALKLINDDIIVSHGSRRRGQHRVCIVDSNKKLLKSFGSESMKNINLLDCPSHLAVDRNGFVMIADQRHSRVLLLNSDLVFQKVMLS